MTILSPKYIQIYISCIGCNGVLWDVLGCNGVNTLSSYRLDQSRKSVSYIIKLT